MATFIMHLVIAEQLWPDLAQRWPGTYGDFLFGNLAPDADKFCPELEQATTHLIGKDESDDWLTQRSQRFVERQAGLLCGPFAQLTPAGQAFALGFLCHLAADEATTSRYEAFRVAYEARTGTPVPNEAVATVDDEKAAGLLQDRDTVLSALKSSPSHAGVLPFIPERCLEAMRWIIFPLIQAGGGFEAYIGLVRRNSLWHRHGQTSEEPMDPDLESKLVAYRQRLLGQEAEARVVSAKFDVAAVIAASLNHCRSRLLELASLA